MAIRVDEAGDSSFPNWPEFRRLFAYDNLVGKVVQGRYEIVRRLGAGGMGVVFLARHIHLDKHFALKIISPRFLDDPDIGARFLLEARAASKIDHPNVVSITDFGVPEEGPAFFAMEHLEGEDLARLLAREGPLPWPRALPMISQVARALAAAHQRGVVHRDIKPQNCFRVTRDDNPDFIKVLDFGLAKVLSGAGASAWTVGGSPGYIAPEIYRGGKVDHRVDIFALGVLTHALLLGRVPAQPVDESPEGAPVRTLAELPPPIALLIVHATHDDVHQRVPTIDAFITALEAARTALTAPAVAVKDMSQKTASRRAWLALTGMTGLALTSAIAAIAMADGDPAANYAATHPKPTVIQPTPTPKDPTTPASAPEPKEPAPTASTSEPKEPAPTASTSAPNDPAPTTPLGSSTPPTPTTPPTTGAPTKTAPTKPVPSDSDRKPPPAFDEPAARALLMRSAGRIAACKADSSFAGMATPVRLSGTVTVTPRGQATVILPPGYDLNPCIERIVAGLKFTPSATGGTFTQLFLL